MTLVFGQIVLSELNRTIPTLEAEIGIFRRLFHDRVLRVDRVR